MLERLQQSPLLKSPTPPGACSCPVCRFIARSAFWFSVCGRSARVCASNYFSSPPPPLDFCQRSTLFVSSTLSEPDVEEMLESVSMLLQHQMEEEMERLDPDVCALSACVRTIVTVRLMRACVCVGALCAGAGACVRL